MKKSKVMMFAIIILLLAVIVETNIICNQAKANSKEKGNNISKLDNTMITEDFSNTNVLKDDTNCIENVLVENTLASVENIKEETNTVKEERKTPSSNNSKISKSENSKEVKPEEIKEPVKTEEVSECVVPEIVTSTQVQIPTPVVNVESEKEVVVEPVSNIVNEEYKYNDSMTQTIVNIINNNPSQYMMQDGFSVVIDSSITSLTNQFTFSEQRVINKISAKAGTIKVYAQDYYFNGEMLFTECYIF